MEGESDDVAGLDSALVDRTDIEKTLNEALRLGGEFAEVFVEDRRTTGISLDDRRVEDLTSGRDRGAGIRVVYGDTTGFAHTADISGKGLVAAAREAASVAHQGGGGVREVRLVRQQFESRANVEVYPETVAKATKVALLQRADDAARSAGAAITQVSVGYGDSRRRFVVANSDGIFAADDQIRWHFIGNIQRNKLARLAEHAFVYEGVTRVSEAAEIARRAPGARILVEVDATGLPGRTGIAPDRVAELVAELRVLEVDVRGLMTVAAPGGGTAASKVFELVATLARDLSLPECSMGMSDDLEEAVREGSTQVRVGTALFGPRGTRG